MKAYIVNLAKDVERKEYVKQLLKPYSSLQVEFIEAVYGKLLTAEELDKRFDSKMALKRYGREMNRGEIGCTLSHFKCYRELLKSNEPYALLLEDDITIMRDFSEIETMASSLPADKPWVLFLSADYWYTSKKQFNADSEIAKIYDAVGTYAYIINRKGAELILSKNSKASNVADHWSLYRHQGLKLYAVYPYMIDANIEEFESSIEQQYFGEVRKNMPLTMRFESLKISLVKKFLLKTNRFVSKIRNKQGGVKLCKLAVLLTCFNRKNKTVRCLESLIHSHKDSNSTIEFDIYLTDDGSTDGTSEAVMKLPFSNRIKILTGNGNLFWNAGMNNSWDEASKSDEYDGYLWLNDDSTIYPDFWRDLEATDLYCKLKYGKGGIYVGSTCDPTTNEFTYGGFNYVNKITLKDKFILPNSERPQECECAHGNITYVSADVEKRMGHLCRKYRHGGGDHDYTYKAHCSGFPILVMPHYAGECENDHLNKPKADISKMSLKERLKHLYSPFGFNFHNTLVFQRRCFPLRYPFVLVSGIMKATFPNLYFKLYLAMRR